MGLIPSKKDINLHGQVKPISIPCSEAKWSRGSSESACVFGGALIVCDVRNARGLPVKDSGQASSFPKSRNDFLADNTVRP